jgi:hypothetical protein
VDAEIGEGAVLLAAMGAIAAREEHGSGVLTMGSGGLHKWQFNLRNFRGVIRGDVRTLTAIGWRAESTIEEEADRIVPIGLR